eukprot:scaffold255238_cov16-Prasinocladus_malaysianus.AAC.1
MYIGCGPTVATRGPRGGVLLSRNNKCLMSSNNRYVAAKNVALVSPMLKSIGFVSAKLYFYSLYP